MQNLLWVILGPGWNLPYGWFHPGRKITHPKSMPRLRVSCGNYAVCLWLLKFFFNQNIANIRIYLWIFITNNIHICIRSKKKLWTTFIFVFVVDYDYEGYLYLYLFRGKNSAQQDLAIKKMIRTANHPNLFM